MAAIPIPSSDTVRLEQSDEALLMLLVQLKQRHYHFVTPTPATHARILARPSRRQARDLRDVLGWSLPFEQGILDSAVFETLLAADALVPLADGRFQSRYRVSTLDGELLLHSAYPTDDEDAVFFGPDSYRFADLIRRELAHCARHPAARLVDIGAGAGVGAIVAAKLYPQLHVTMSDINAAALRLARINARAAGINAAYALGADLNAVEGPIDIALANPPYIIDAVGRRYRDGGDSYGARVSYEMAAAAIDRLTPQGRLILYTGSAIIEGEDPLREALTNLAARQRCTLQYAEIDPDMFGEELEKSAYRDVERIAIVGAVITKLD